jgi:hypothetical protein
MLNVVAQASLEAGLGRNERLQKEPTMIFWIDIFVQALTNALVLFLTGIFESLLSLGQ